MGVLYEDLSRGGFWGGRSGVRAPVGTQALEGDFLSSMHIICPHLVQVALLHPPDLPLRLIWLLPTYHAPKKPGLGD